VGFALLAAWVGARRGGWGRSKLFDEVVVRRRETVCCGTTGLKTIVRRDWRARKRFTSDVEGNAKRSGRRSGGWKAPNRNRAVLCQRVGLGELLDKGRKGKEHSKLPPPGLSSLPPFLLPGKMAVVDVRGGNGEVCREN